MVSMQPQAITKVSISALVISLPIIYVSLLRVPPSTLARDSTFWFLMSNSIIAIIAADSGMLFFSSTSRHHHNDDYYSDVVPEDYYGDAIFVRLTSSSYEPTAPVDIPGVMVGGGEQLLPTGGSDKHNHLSDALGEQLAVTVQEDYYSYAMSMPSMASSHEPRVPVDMSDVVVVGGDEQLLPTGGAASCKVTGTAGMDEGHALALIEGEGAASKPSTDMVDHAFLLQRCEEEEAAAAAELEPISTNKNDTMIVKGDQCTILPVPRLTATPDDDVPQDEVKPRCSVAEESKTPRPGEEREYWQLSDEELNRKVEEFITRFNQDMIEQEASCLIDLRLKEIDTETKLPTSRL